VLQSILAQQESWTSFARFGMSRGRKLKEINDSCFYCYAWGRGNAKGNFRPHSKSLMLAAKTLKTMDIKESWQDWKWILVEAESNGF